MKRYRVKVTEKHCDHVWVEAESEEEAQDEAVKYAECEYELLYDSQVVAEEEAE